MPNTASERVPEPLPEAWLRGVLVGVNPLAMPVFFTFAQVREDLTTHTAGLTSEQVWRKIGAASLGFHLKHMAGSVDRLTTYLLAGQLTPEQLARLKEESHGNEDLPILIEQVEASLRGSEARLQTLHPNTLYETRGVGRNALPTTVIGLIVHLSEHTQRHLGQAVTLCQVLRQLS